MAHAILSASGSHRWLHCTPSARLEEQFEDGSSPYAREGTLAHHVAENELKYRLGYIQKSTHARRLRNLKTWDEYDPEMETYIADYADRVEERIAEHGACSVMLEQKLDYSAWVPEGYGTGDVVIVSDYAIEVIDLKYGKGEPVSAENNQQARLYALGAYSTYNVLYEADKVISHIIQPRLDSDTTEILPIEDLLEWADGVVKPAAAMAWKGEGDYQAGPHCKFCRASAVCRTRSEKQQELAKYDFADPDVLSDDEIADILERAQQLKDWVKDIEAYALDQAANHGKEYPGWKVVEGRSKRKITDTDAVAALLKEHGYKPDDIYRIELQTLTNLEKLVGKKRFSEIVDEYIEKPTGKPTLVPETDKRRPMSRESEAQSDFA